MTTMTPLETHPQETLRERARLARALRADGIAFAARQRPSYSANGDFATAVRLGPGRWLVAVGDVMGRGPSAARLADRIVEHVQERAPRALTLGDLLGTTNELVYDLTDGERFVSMLLLDFDVQSGTVRLANAGHEVPLAVGRSGGVVALEGHGPALGLLRDTCYRGSGPLRLARGMILLATTDGVIEAVDRRGRRYGRDRAARALAECREQGPKAVVRRVIREASKHAAHEDDRTAVALQFLDLPSEPATPRGI